MPTGFSVGPGDLNSDPHACMAACTADTLPMEPSLQPSSGPYMRSY